MQAAQYGQLARLMLLAKAGFDRDAKDSNGWTAMMFAAFTGQVDCLSFLVKETADLEAKDKHGVTASMWAARFGHMDCVQLIGAEIERRALLSVIITPADTIASLRI